MTTTNHTVGATSYLIPSLLWVENIDWDIRYVQDIFDVKCVHLPLVVFPFPSKHTFFYIVEETVNSLQFSRCTELGVLDELVAVACHDGQGLTANTNGNLIVIKFIIL